MASRIKLPNLKISVDNTQSSDDSEVEVAVAETSSVDGDDFNEDIKPRVNTRLEDGEVHEEDEQDVLSIGTTEPTERRFLSTGALRTQATYGPRIYENKTGNFVTGVDITSEEATEKREKRTQRFGTLSTPKQPITDVDIKNLYKSLGMSTDTLDQDLRGWRTDAILLRGTENMSTKDVFDYFSEYAPKGVEWIDDFSCNVLWQDKLTPARALLKLSSSMEEVGATERPSEVEGPHVHGVSPLKRDKQKDSSENVTESNTDTTDTTSGPVSAAATSVPEQQPTPATDDRTHDEPVLNILMDEAMELDYDDNLDLTEEDPIDKALSTWANFSQNKKVKAEQTKEVERKKSETQKEKERISQKEKMYQDIEVKEEKDFNKKSGGRNKETVPKRRNIPESDDQNQTRLVSSRTTHGKNSSKLDRSKNKSKAAEMSQSLTQKKNEKMDASDESDTESSSSGSSSSSSGSSSSSSSGSSTSSGSDSESGSRSSASSVDTIKAKQRKSRERRDKDNEARKNSRRAAPPPILPQAKEKVDIPWPPGWWRLGVPYPKAKYLFLRYAMKADKKLPGAEKRSKYYVKHGNPNFGGIVGLISKSRKRRLKNVDKEEEPFEVDSDSLDVAKNEESVEGTQSRLAGRIGVRGDLGGSKQRDEHDVDEKPRLKAGRDLRDLLNRDVSAVQHDSGDKPEAINDSDGEMDYGAELERLMGDDAPPTKKRFMRMHADDEEEKIIAKRLLNVRKDTTKWPRGDYIEEEDVEEEEEFEPEEIPRPQRKEWVDYDNVEDDDPFNLFGTSKGDPPKKVSDDEEDIDGDAGRTFRRDKSSDRTGRDVRQRLGTSDLRAKIQGLKKASSRTW